MLLFLSLTGIFLSVLLLVFSANKNRSSWYLGGFYFLISIYGLIQYSILYSKSLVFVSIAFFNFTFLTYLIGPIFYWYIRSVLSDNSRVKRWELLHLLPSAIFFVTAIPYMLTPWSYKTEIAHRLLSDISYLNVFKASVLFKIIPVSVIFLSRPVLVLIYTIWSAVLFLLWIWQKSGSRVLYQQRNVTIWITVLLLFLFLLSTINIMIMIDSFTKERVTAFFTVNLLLVLGVAGFIGVLVSPFFFPVILYGLPRVPEHAKAEPSETEKLSLPIIPETNNHISLGSDYLSSIGKKMHSCMQEYEPYLQKDFNLAQLSAMTHIPLHHLSFYFRTGKKQSFNDYRNTWRVNHAKVLMREGKADKMTLEAIGLLSGFTSRNTFFIAFKKAEGISPSGYLDHFSS